MTLGDRIREARTRAGLTQKDVAAHFGIKPAAVSQWETDATTPEAGRLLALAALLKVDVQQFLADQSAPALPIELMPESNVRAADGHKMIAFGQLPKDVPIYGTTQGGAGQGDFSLNMGDRIDWARRLPGASGRGVFALYVQGDSMSPWREHGDLVYCDANRTPKVGEYGVIEMLPQIDGDDVRAYLKRIVRYTEPTLIVAQFNPPMDDLAIPRRAIKKVHRVIDWSELTSI